MRAVHLLIVMIAVLAPAPWQARPAAAGQAPAAPAKPAAQAASPATPASAPQGQPAKPAAPAPAPAAPTTPAAGAPAAPAAMPPAQEAYTYRPDGRRDPFTNLLGAGAKGEVHTRRGEGAAGLTVGELSVRGVMQSRGAMVAMIEGPDKKTYIVHAGDKLLDGTIKNVTPQGLIVVQEVNDPLSLIKQREVRKLLRSLEDAKE